MAVQQQYRSGKERRTFDMSSALPTEKEQRWNKDRRFTGDEDELYDPDWEVLEEELEPYTHMAHGDY
jgi:hypothetical protein